MHICLWCWTPHQPPCCSVDVTVCWPGNCGRPAFKRHNWQPTILIWYWKTHLSHLHQQAQEQPTDCSLVFLGKQSPVPNGFTFPLAYPFSKFVHSWSKVPGFITESGFSVALKCKSMVKGKVCRDSWTIMECPSLEKVKFVYVECGGSVSVLCYFFPTNCCLALFLFALLVFTLWMLWWMWVINRLS